MSAVLPLYAIVDELMAIEEQLTEAGGELTPEIESALDAIEGTFVEKVEAVCRMRQNTLSTAKAYQDEADRLSARAKTLTRTAESVKRYLHVSMERAGRTKLEAGTFRLSVRRNSQPKVTLSVDPVGLPFAFRRVIERIELDRDYALEAWKDGGSDALPSGVHVEVGTHLRIL